MKRILRHVALLGALALATLATPALSAERAIIVLDASGSMWGQIDGEAKMAIARRTLEQAMGTVPASLDLGLIAYGHREKGSCSDIELVVPAGPSASTGPEIVAAANALVPKGKTPLSAAVRQAAEALHYTEDKATVILITDGIETCDADPCAVGAALAEAGIDLKVHVVGFGLSKAEGRQVACLAENTGGRYFDASNAGRLAEALSETVAAAAPAEEPPAPIAQVEDRLRAVARLSSTSEIFQRPGSIRFDIHKARPEGGFEQDILTTGYAGESFLGYAAFDLPPGRYRVVASRDLAKAEADIDVTAGKPALVDITLDAGVVVARGMKTASEPITDDNLRWDVTGSSQEIVTTYGTGSTTVIAAGAADITASLGAAKATLPVDVRAGVTTTVDVVLGAGRLTLRGKRSVTAPDLDDSIRWDVTDAAGETATAYGGAVDFDLPAGPYAVKATLGEAIAELAIVIEAGQTLEQTVVVATGKVVARSLFAEGGPTVKGARFDVLAAEAGADGSRKVIATSYDDGTAFDLPPGSYLLKAQSDIASGESRFEARAGEPVEVPVILNAGLLAVTAPGGDRLDLLSEKKDIYGKHAELATSYGESWQITVPAGSYVVRVRKANSNTEVTGSAIVKPGERTEVTVE
ncbi:VWA domain-containing protein [Kaistia defluvii]|uniref:VWA domain-containing protein n=1 Tax=Kaistia defluvii TaxID=410841 RepID=UPI0022550BF1|nr:VWA domain-containing protein [Kaistia defluvii]MCX5520002.1 VWA domain-containing protein [Kaistia defluvii]